MSEYLEREPQVLNPDLLEEHYIVVRGIIDAYAARRDGFTLDDVYEHLLDNGLEGYDHLEDFSELFEEAKGDIVDDYAAMEPPISVGWASYVLPGKKRMHMLGLKQDQTLKAPLNGELEALRATSGEIAESTEDAKDVPEPDVETAASDQSESTAETTADAVKQAASEVADSTEVTASQVGVAAVRSSDIVFQAPVARPTPNPATVAKDLRRLAEKRAATIPEGVIDDAAAEENRLDAERADMEMAADSLSEGISLDGPEAFELAKRLVRRRGESDVTHPLLALIVPMVERNKGEMMTPKWIRERFTKLSVGITEEEVDAAVQAAVDAGKLFGFNHRDRKGQLFYTTNEEVKEDLHQAPQPTSERARRQNKERPINDKEVAALIRIMDRVASDGGRQQRQGYRPVKALAAEFGAEHRIDPDVVRRLILKLGSNSLVHVQQRAASRGGTIQAVSMEPWMRTRWNDKKARAEALEEIRQFKIRK